MVRFLNARNPLYALPIQGYHLDLSTGACGAVLRSWFSLTRNVDVKGLKSLCGGGVPFSHPSLGLCVFFLFIPCVPDRPYKNQDPARAGGDPVLLPPLVFGVSVLFIYLRDGI